MIGLLRVLRQFFTIFMLAQNRGLAQHYYSASVALPMALYKYVYRMI